MALLSFNEFKDLGLNISLTIDQKKIERLIFDATERMSKYLSNFDEVVKNEEGEYNSVIPELKKGLAYLVYGFLLIDTSNVTRFGAVKKQSDFSLSLQLSEVQVNASVYFKRGCELFRKGMHLTENITGKKNLKLPFYSHLRGFYEKEKEIY